MEMTICVKCKHIYPEEGISHSRLCAASSAPKKIDPVTGEISYDGGMFGMVFCSILNKGNCKKFEAK